MNLKRITLDDTVEETVNKINENSTDIEESVSRLEADFISYKDNITLKTSKIEKELNDYKATMQQVNIHQSPTQKASGHGIVSLPPNAAEGQISVVAKGLTATNLVKNGNFANGATNWAASYATISVSQNTASIIGTGTNSSAYITQKLPIKRNGQKLYARMKAKVTNSECKQIELMVGTLSVVQANPAANTEYFISGVLTMGNDGIDVWCVPRHHYDSAEAAAGKVMEVKEVMVVDLTAIFGAGNEPDKETCDKIFANWFDATKSTLSARVKSVGKNLFNHNDKITQGTTYVSYQRTADYIEVSNTSGSFQFIKTAWIMVEPNTNYTLSFEGVNVSGTDAPRIRVTAEDDITGLVVKGGSGFITFNTGANKKIRLYLYASTDTNAAQTKRYSKIQIEKGTTATAYEPYKETVFYAPANIVLRSLPNGVKDEFNVAERRVIKRTKKIIFDGSENWTGFMTDYADTNGFYRMQINGWVTQNKAVTSANTGQAWNDLATFRVVVSIAAGGLPNSIGFHPDGNLYLSLPRDYIDANYSPSIEGMRQYLADHPITLNYQLAEPVEIPVQVSGTLLSYPSGTVYVENVVADAGLYSDGITVLHQDLPIKSIEKISKIDYETGLETILDASKAVIASDKLSFTHPDLSEGDIVFFEYEYDLESTQGETEIEYYDSRYVIKDSVTDKFYKWHIIVADGVPSIELVEV